ncbi:MAG: hypothetical protein LH478_16065 [Chitinophagaceae bacterium]|nr:hypothetical protein [Chitinophagaceae bacterium]
MTCHKQLCRTGASQSVAVGQATNSGAAGRWRSPDRQQVPIEVPQFGCTYAKLMIRFKQLHIQRKVSFNTWLRLLCWHNSGITYRVQANFLKEKE